MKNLISFIFLLAVTILFSSCGAKDSPDHITFGQAWDFAWSSEAYKGYRVWAIIVPILCVGLVFLGRYMYKSVEIAHDVMWVWIFGALIFILIMSSVFLPVLNLQGTTIEMLERGGFVR